MAKNQEKKFRPTKLRLEDEVVVIAGKEKGKRGSILFIDKAGDRVVVQGVNRVTRFQRPTQENPQGGQIEVEMPIHISNVQYYDSKAKQGVRIGVKKDGKNKIRLTRKAGEEKEIKGKAKEKQK